MEEKEKCIVLFKAKCNSLDKQIAICRKLLEQLNILEYNSCEEDLSVSICLKMVYIYFKLQYFRKNFI